MVVWGQWLGLARYGACTEQYGVGTEWVRSKYRVGMMQVLITIIQYHEIL